MPDIYWLQRWIELISTATTVAELCKKLVHSNINQGQGVGAHIYLLDNKGLITPLGGYGVNPMAEQSSVSTWDSHFLADAIRDRAVSHQEADFSGSKVHCYAIPILRGDEPLGSAMFCQREQVEHFSKEINLAMSQAMGLWLQSVGMANGFSSNKTNTEPNPQDLTERQLKILEQMNFGKTNAEIAQELILSESSIRQETVKIYRALGVSSRAEAAKRAIHLGILRASAI